MNAIVAVAVGGALGAVLRHGVNIGAVKMLGHGFPYGTLIVNILGSFLMGALITVMAHSWQASDTVRFFLVTGLLGAFTTFSTFSLDAVTLWERKDYLQTALYMGGSVALSIAALVLAMFIVRTVVS
ncbi:MAG: fluoride efflux transporter CrcB [Alphaproteobacteria bacterium]|nr:fluoride efflux transporter CrcB [Alphaproteobacteria bacterium]